MAVFGPGTSRIDRHDLLPPRRSVGQLRIGGIRCSTAAGSGNPSFSLSAADRMTVLLTPALRLGSFEGTGR